MSPILEPCAGDPRKKRACGAKAFIAEALRMTEGYYGRCSVPHLAHQMPVCETEAEAVEQWNRAQAIVREERQRLKAVARHLPRGSEPRVRPCQFRFADGAVLSPTDAVRRFVLEHPGLYLEQVAEQLSTCATFETVVLSLHFWKHNRPETSIRHAVRFGANCRVTFSKRVFPREASAE